MLLIYSIIAQHLNVLLFCSCARLKRKQWPTADSTKRCKCPRTSPHACAVQCLLQTENQVAMGAGRHKTIQIGHTAIGHHLHTTIASQFNGRHYGGRQRQRRWHVRQRRTQHPKLGEFFCFNNFLFKFKIILLSTPYTIRTRARAKVYSPRAYMS